ncbi:MAG: DUF1566 domain-containing protein [Thermodesulfobacteriota bacterium]|nr:DUF1566 domain-containing protein [Thermodesulfobacteriota bacterium]
MDMFKKLKLSDTTVANIEWEMTPDLAFCTFSAKGLRKELTNTSERVCYFFIDNWGDEPKLYLMERGVKYVNILAEVKAPPAMMIDCITSQGGTPSSRDNYPLDSALKDWLLAEVVESEDSPFLIPVTPEKAVEEDMGEPLPPLGGTGFSGDKVILPAEHCTLHDDQIDQLMTQWNFYDSRLNPQGKFANALANSGDGLTVIDEQTGIMWQRTGLDLGSIRSQKRSMEQLNKDGFAGYHDWRMPTVEEAMSLMETVPNIKGVHLHPCFSKEQPFIFVAARRKPTGYWFVDYKQGKVYWSSGTVPGGFCRLCRRVGE